VLRSREWTAIRHLLSSIVSATKSSEHHVGGGHRTDESFLSDDSLDEGERGLCDAFCPFLRSYAVVCQFRAITLVSIMDDCRRLKRTEESRFAASGENI
ncbi:MAG: hypothetical protein WAV49_01585, partial [Bifidobacterium adolescentis]